jgi:hypothetical protein
MEGDPEHANLAIAVMVFGRWTRAGSALAMWGSGWRRRLPSSSLHAHPSFSSQPQRTRHEVLRLPWPVSWCSLLLHNVSLTSLRHHPFARIRYHTLAYVDQAVHSPAHRSSDALQGCGRAEQEDIKMQNYGQQYAEYQRPGSTAGYPSAPAVPPPYGGVPPAVAYEGTELTSGAAPQGYQSAAPQAQSQWAAPAQSQTPTHQQWNQPQQQAGGYNSNVYGAMPGGYSQTQVRCDQVARECVRSY